MKRKKYLGALFCMLAVIFWCVAGTICPVSAADGGGSLTLWCVKDDVAISEMHWQLYRVGHRSEKDYIFEDGFAGYRATLGDRTKPMPEWDAETLSSAAETLKIHAIANELPKLAENDTDDKGCAVFSGLEDGLYLVWGDILKTGNTTYIPSAIFFEISGGNEAVLNAYPKIVLRTLKEQSASYSVRKVWMNDEDQPWNRAVSITVERYRDNVYYDSLTLSEENDWTYTWDEKEGHEWFVREKVIPENYTVAYKDNHTQYLIVNTYSPTTDDSSRDTQVTTATTDDHAYDTQTTAVTDQSTDVMTSTNEERSTTGASQSSTVQTSTQTVTTTDVTSKGDDLPQTGQLWWPVPVLAGGGLLLFGIGMYLRKKKGSE